MKKLAILLILLLIQNYTFSQTKNASFPFKVEIRGKGDPVILIPGLACSGEVWSQTVDSLQKKYTCYILTLAGFTKQKPIDINKGFLPIVQEKIAEYIKNELTEKPIIIGHSLGGFLILSIASSHPHLVKKVIIVDSYPFSAAAMNPNATTESTQSQAEMLKKTLISLDDTSFEQQQQMTWKTMITHTDKIKLATKWSLESDRKTIAQAMYELMTIDLRNKVQHIKCPILVLGSWYGLKDYGITKEMVKGNYDKQFKTAKHYSIKIAETAKHFIMWDDPDWFYQQVKRFLNNG